jgi:hypothetical protein
MSHGPTISSPVSSPVSSLELLVAARRSLADPSRWTCSDNPAITADGKRTAADARNAVAWSAWGAVFADDRLKQRSLAALGALNALRSCLDKHTTVPDFNARASHAQVIALYDKAIQKLSKAS